MKNYIQRENGFSANLGLISKKKDHELGIDQIK